MCEAFSAMCVWLRLLGTRKASRTASTMSWDWASWNDARLGSGSGTGSSPSSISSVFVRDIGTCTGRFDAIARIARGSHERGLTPATSMATHTNPKSLRALALCVALPIAVGCQQGAQNVDGAVPEWARTGNFTFARWDGGPLEGSKGVLSGWPGFVVPDPQVIYATTHLYDPATIELLERAHVNWIWVTWSVGFSNETEAAQQAILRKYIEECHRHGIHVTAYISISNIFWQDMFANVPESKDWLLRINGQPVPYGTADYAAVGQVTRYLADLSLEAWQEYTLARVIAAVEAGADGIMFDNSSSYYSRELLERFTARALAEARKRNPQVLVSSNYSREQLLAARVENAITSEQGWEPGVFPSPAPPPDRWNGSTDM